MIWFFGLVSAMVVQAGNEVGNGGESSAIEFVALGRSIHQELLTDNRFTFNREKLAKALEEVRVEVGEGLLLNGAFVDAINYPTQKKILLDRSRWSAKSLPAKKSLVLHEYLGVMEEGDKNYEISSFYLAESEKVEEGRNGLWTFAAGVTKSAYTGSLKKLYDDSLLGYDLRLGRKLGRPWEFFLEGGMHKANYQISSIGFVAIETMRMSGSIAYSFYQSSSIRGPSFKALLGGSYQFRKHAFESFGIVQRDSAPGIHLGLEGAYPLAGRFSLLTQARLSRTFFKDRHASLSPRDGINDQRGDRINGLFGLEYIF